ncbi:MAG: branched-chain amino acid ABC transporter permease, partial [Pikeienuella sp.]
GVGFFYGPIIGAIVFTLLATVLKLQTDLWQLYLGALFVLTVMFFPGGLAGLIAMHGPALRAGRLGGLIPSYLRTLVPGVAGALGLIAATELLFHLREAPPGDEVAHVFWMALPSDSVIVWAVALAITVVGFWLAAKGAPAMKAAWDAANMPPEGEEAA